MLLMVSDPSMCHTSCAILNLGESTHVILYRPERAFYSHSQRFLKIASFINKQTD